MQSVFEMTAGNTVEICQKFEIYHENTTCNYRIAQNFDGGKV